MTNVLLIGYRGTGKTTVGWILAEQLGWAFVDADDEVEQRAGKSIAEIFAAEGEQAFRDLEQQVVAELAQRDRHVISLGGGAILREENRNAIRGGGKVVWLTAPAVEIHQRLHADDTTTARRPDLTKQGGLAEIEQLLAVRHEHYEACADITMETQSKPPEEIAAAILSSLDGDGF